MNSNWAPHGGAVLVTGGSRGLGRGIALELASAGFSVAINYRSNTAAAEETAELCRQAALEGGTGTPAAGTPAAGDTAPPAPDTPAPAPPKTPAAAGEVGPPPAAGTPAAGTPAAGDTAPPAPDTPAPAFVPIQGDISRAEDRERLVDRVFADFGGLYGLVNNAGISPRERADIVEASVDSFTEVLGTNLTAPYFLTQLVVQRWLRDDRGAPTGPGAPGGTSQAPPFREPHHHIVFVGSISAATASINRGEYCVSKAGLAMAAELWATRLAPEGINVYEVRPGIMETDMTAGVHQKYSRLIREGLVPQRRWGQGTDVGRMVRSLIGGDFPFSTGAVIYADGGFHISRL